jgi:hypothetical protein
MCQAQIVNMLIFILAWRLHYFDSKDSKGGEVLHKIQQISGSGFGKVFFAFPSLNVLQLYILQASCQPLKRRKNMCSIRCQTSQSNRCRCSCGGALHGIKNNPEKRFDQLSHLLTDKTLLVGNRYPIKGMVLDFDGKMVSLVFRRGKPVIKDIAHGAFYLPEWFDFVQGIPF